MKKGIIGFLSTFLTAALCMAGMIKTVHTDVGSGSEVQTNDHAAFLSGFVEGVYLDWTGSASFTGTVSIVTAGGTGGMPSRTILSKAGLTADAYYPIRLIPTKTDATAITANEDARLPLLQDNITVTISGVSTQDVDTLDVTTYILID